MQLQVDPERRGSITDAVVVCGGVAGVHLARHIDLKVSFPHDERGEQAAPHGWNVQGIPCCQCMGLVITGAVVRQRRICNLNLHISVIST